jgi:regulator of nonsense transcripts 3
MYNIMSTPTTTNSATPSKSKAKKYKDKDKARDRDRKEKTLLPSERLKIVVRRLPPNLPEEIFWQSVSNWVTDESALWKAYYLGKPKKRCVIVVVQQGQGLMCHSANKENIPSRAYIAFKTLEQLLAFSREYDGHKFVDKAGIITLY